MSARQEFGWKVTWKICVLRAENPDPIELAKLRQETRTDLQKILTAPQLEEFLLRYSQNANEMRSESGELQISPPLRTSFAICSAART